MGSLIEKIALARDQYNKLLADAGRESIDEVIREFFQEMRKAAEIQLVLVYANSHGETPDPRHIGIRVEFDSGLFYENEEFNAPDSWEESEIADAIEELKDYSWLDVLYADLADNLDVVTHVFPDAKRITIARVFSNQPIVYDVKTEY